MAILLDGHLFSIMKVTIIIPALNEEQSIALVLNELKFDFIHKVIVVNNGSTDNTALVAKESGAVVIDEPQRGYGKACMTGIEEALKDRPDYIAFLDADYSDNPKNLVDLFKKALDGFDLVVGSRVIRKDASKALLPQARFGNWLATNLMFLFFGGTKFTDLGPFRIIRTSTLKKLQMQDQDFGWTVEMQAKALIHKINSAEIAVDYKDRIGKSKISGTVKGSVLAGNKILQTIFKLYLKKLMN